MSSLQAANIGWEAGKQKRQAHPIPELKESLQLKWHNMEGKWPSDELVPDFEDFSKVFRLGQFHPAQSHDHSSSTVHMRRLEGTLAPMSLVQH